MGRIVMLGWCASDWCYEIIHDEFTKLTMGDLPEDKHRLEFVSSFKEIEGLINSGDIETFAHPNPEIYVEHGIEGEDTISLLRKIASLFETYGQDPDFITCLLRKDLALSAAIQEAGFKVKVV